MGVNFKVSVYPKIDHFLKKLFFACQIGLIAIFHLEIISVKKD